MEIWTLWTTLAFAVVLADKQIEEIFAAEKDFRSANWVRCIPPWAARGAGPVALRLRRMTMP
jgi:hypothetical protein